MSEREIADAEAALEALVAPPFDDDLFVRLAPEAARCYGALARYQPARGELLRDLLARDILGVADLRDRAVLLYAAPPPPGGAWKIGAALGGPLRELVAARARALAVSETVLVNAVLCRAGSQLFAITGDH